MFFKKRAKIELLMKMRPTNRYDMKMMLFQIYGGDIDKAERAYNFMCEGMDDLPAFQQQPPTAMQQVKDTAGSVFGWLKENKDDIAQGIQFVQSLRGKVPVTNPTDIPPLPPMI